MCEDRTWQSVNNNSIIMRQLFSFCALAYHIEVSVINMHHQLMKLNFPPQGSANVIKTHKDFDKNKYVSQDSISKLV